MPRTPGWSIRDPHGVVRAHLAASVPEWAVRRLLERTPFSWQRMPDAP